MILLDTNILVRYVEPTKPSHAMTIAAIGHCQLNGEQLAFVPQSCYEFWATATRPVAANGRGWTPTQCQSQLQLFRQLFRFLPDSPRLFTEWELLVTQYACHGRISFDARLVAAMRTHNLTQLLTFNGSDFTRFPGITILDPNPFPTTPHLAPVPLT